MSTPTKPMLPAQTRAEIVGFVTAVERELDDLPGDDVAELTGGLEADLIEAWAAEGTTPTQRFGSPSAYAAELRSAAGLPERGRRPARFEVDLRKVGGQVRESVGRSPGGGTLLQWADDFQPAWWVMRGVLVATFPLAWFGVPYFSRSGKLIVAVSLAALVLWSLRWRSAGAAVGGTRRILLGWNAIAAVSILFAPVVFLNFLATQNTLDSVYDYDGSADQTGLSLDGVPVTNIFAYDEDGKPLKRVRLYNQQGEPLNAGEHADETDDSGATYRMTADVQGPNTFNVFPLLRQLDNGTATPGPAQPAPLPFAETGALSDAVTLPSASATPQPDQAEDGQ